MIEWLIWNKRFFMIFECDIIIDDLLLLLLLFKVEVDGVQRTNGPNGLRTARRRNRQPPKVKSETKKWIRVINIIIIAV